MQTPVYWSQRNRKVIFKIAHCEEKNDQSFYFLLYRDSHVIPLKWRPNLICLQVTCENNFYSSIIQCQKWMYSPKGIFLPQVLRPVTNVDCHSYFSFGARYFVARVASYYFFKGLIAGITGRGNLPVAITWSTRWEVHSSNLGGKQRTAELDFFRYATLVIHMIIANHAMFTTTPNIDLPTVRVRAILIFSQFFTVLPISAREPTLVFVYD